MRWPQDCRIALTFHLMPNDSIDTNQNIVIIRREMLLQRLLVKIVNQWIVLRSNLIINTHGQFNVSREWDSIIVGGSSYSSSIVNRFDKVTDACRSNLC